MWSQLTVEKSTKRYNDPGRLIPGARFEYMGEYYVLSGQLSNGQYLRAYGDKKTNYPAKKMPDHKTQRETCICCVESAALHY